MVALYQTVLAIYRRQTNTFKLSIFFYWPGCPMFSSLLAAVHLLFYSSSCPSFSLCWSELLDNFYLSALLVGLLDTIDNCMGPSVVCEPYNVSNPAELRLSEPWSCPLLYSQLTSLHMYSGDDIATMDFSKPFYVLTSLSFFAAAHISLAYKITSKIVLSTRLACRVLSIFTSRISFIMVNAFYPHLIL